MKLIEAKATVEKKAPQQGALIKLVPAIRVMSANVTFTNVFYQRLQFDLIRAVSIASTSPLNLATSAA
jgi:hypothetical protein